MSDPHDPVVADLQSLTARLGERLVTARREVDAIDALLARLPGAVTPAPAQSAPPEVAVTHPVEQAAPPTVDPTARLRAIALALDGHDRAETRDRLTGELEHDELEAVLDDVFGPGR